MYYLSLSSSNNETTFTIPFSYRKTNTKLASRTLLFPPTSPSPPRRGCSGSSSILADSRNRISDERVSPSPRIRGIPGAPWTILENRKSAGRGRIRDSPVRPSRRSRGLRGRDPWISRASGDAVTTHLTPRPSLSSSVLSSLYKRENAHLYDTLASAPSALFVPPLVICMIYYQPASSSKFGIRVCNSVPSYNDLCTCIRYVPIYPY